MSSTLLDRLFMAQVASCGCLTKTPEVSYHKEDCCYRILNEAHRRIELLESALRFYAHGHHFFGDKETWDTVSGEPQNFWCNEAGDATVEDGSIAKKFLLGHWQDWAGHEAPDLLPEERAAQETEGTALMPDLAEAIKSGVPLVQQLKPTFPCLGCDEPVTERDTYCAPCKKHNDEIAARGDKEWAERACKVCNRMHPDHSPTCTYYL